MNKLIQLLNEHRTELLHGNIQNKPMRYSYGGYVFGLSDLTEQNCILLIISKDYGFIKRLVDNDKIDREKVYEEIGGCIKVSGLGPHYPFRAAVIMILSIEDSPIDDLISYLR